MSKKYQVNHVNICPFKITDRGFIPMRNEYPTTRLCVIDRDEGFAIDVNHELKYDFLESSSMLYFMNGASKKIKENKRAAINPITNLGLSEEDKKKVENILWKLEIGYEFEDGNDVLSNEEYLRKIEEEKQKIEEKPKVKRLSKRKK